MKYTIRTTKSASVNGWRHEILRDGQLTSYAEYGQRKKPPARMLRWVKRLNGEQHFGMPLRSSAG